MKNTRENRKVGCEFNSLGQYFQRQRCDWAKQMDLSQESCKNITVSRMTCKVKNYLLVRKVVVM